MKSEAQANLSSAKPPSPEVQFLSARIDRMVGTSPAAFGIERPRLNSDEASLLKKQILAADEIRGASGVVEELIWSHRKCYDLQESYLQAIHRDMAVWIPLSLGIFGYSITTLSGKMIGVGLIAAAMLYLVFLSLFLRASIFMRANRRLAFALEELIGGLSLHMKQAFIGGNRTPWITSIRSIIVSWSVIFLAAVLSAFMLWLFNL